MNWLGVFIFRGIAIVNNTLLMAGALPAEAIALAADALLRALEKWRVVGSGSWRRRKARDRRQGLQQAAGPRRAAGPENQGQPVSAGAARRLPRQQLSIPAGLRSARFYGYGTLAGTAWTEILGLFPSPRLEHMFARLARRAPAYPQPEVDRSGKG